jgi:hypothetical protein
VARAGQVARSCIPQLLRFELVTTNQCLVFSQGWIFNQIQIQVMVGQVLESLEDVHS